MKQQKKLVKDYVTAGVTLGAGASVLGGMGQGAIAGKIATPAAGMMGVGITAGMGMGVMNMVANKTKEYNKNTHHKMPSGKYMKGKKHMGSY